MTLRDLIDSTCWKANKINCPDVLSDLEILYDQNIPLVQLLEYFFSWQFILDQKNCLYDLDDCIHNCLDPYLVLSSCDDQLIMQLKMLDSSNDAYNEQ